MSRQHHRNLMKPMYPGEEACNNVHEDQDPLEAVERAVEEALEMLLRDDELQTEENASDQDSITTACRVAAEQSLRDELALADSGFVYRYNYFPIVQGGEESFRRNCYHTLSFEEDMEDQQDCKEWWLELKQESIAGTCITEASSCSWSSSSGGGRITTGANMQNSLFAIPEDYWENLARISNNVQPRLLRIDLVVASNLLAVAWSSRCRSCSMLLLWRSWKQQLDERLNVKVWTRLLGTDETYHVVVLAVPLLGSALQIAKTRRCTFGFLTDTWCRYLTNNHPWHEIQEID